MRGDPPVVNFNGGEVSPLMYGRTDYAKYSSSAQLCENFIPSILGPLRRRPGTQYTGNPKRNGFAAEDVVLIPFVASTANEFVLEVGSGYMRFWDASTRKIIRDDGSGNWSPNNAGVEAELATPWLTADLYTRDEHNNINGVGLAWAQSNDVMWISARNWPTVKLKRIAQYKFSFGFMGDGFNIPTPFDDLDPLNAITVTASGFTGVGITLTASSALFSAADVNCYIYLEQPAVDNIPQWEPAKAKLIGDRVRSNGRNYIALNSATTGTFPPSHSSSSKVDGNTGVFWRWTDDGYGVAAITAFTSPTVVTATVNFELPGTLVSTGTLRWSRQAWRAATGFPTAVSFFRNRLCFGRDNTVWTSVNSDFENFTRKQAGLVTLDLAFVGTLAADRNDKVLWLYGDTALLAGTASGEWAIGEQANAQPFGPGNAKAEKQAGYGAIAQPPIKVDALLYMQKGGNRLREFAFDALAGVSGKWKSTDRSQLAEHMAPQFGYLTAVQQRQPESVVWVSSASGRLYSMTYDKDQNVYAWARHRLGGFGVLGNGPIVSAMCGVKSPDGVNDDVWMLVHRFDNNTPNTTLEVLGPALGIFETSRYAFHDIAYTQDANYLDCCSTTTVGAAASAIIVNPLQIVAGATVAALINGCVESDAPIAASGYPINPTADIRPARVGYRYVSNYWSLPLQGQSATGTAQGKIGRVWKNVLRVWNSVGFILGARPDDIVLDRKEFRTQDMTMNDPVPLQSGDFALSPNTAYLNQPTIFLQQDQPLPLTVLGIFPKLDVEDAA